MYVHVCMYVCMFVRIYVVVFFVCGKKKNKFNMRKFVLREVLHYA